MRWKWILLNAACLTLIMGASASELPSRTQSKFKHRQTDNNYDFSGLPSNPVPLPMGDDRRFMSAERDIGCVIDYQGFRITTGFKPSEPRLMPLLTRYLPLERDILEPQKISFLEIVRCGTGVLHQSFEPQQMHRTSVDEWNSSEFDPYTPAKRTGKKEMFPQSINSGYDR